VYDLQNQKHQLEQFVSRFRNINRGYLQIRRIDEEVVDRLLTERKSLLSSALIAVIEDLRMNPDRCAVIYNSKYDDYVGDIFDKGSANTTSVDISSSSYTSPHCHFSTKAMKSKLLLQ
jgi:hypothetical protein